MDVQHAMPLSCGNASPVKSGPPVSTCCVDMRLGGGVATVRQYLEAGLVDEMHLAIAPALLGRGKSLLAGIDLPKPGYRVVRHGRGEVAAHLVISHGH